MNVQYALIHYVIIVRMYVGNVEIISAMDVIMTIRKNVTNEGFIFINFIS
ncbi:MAG: hypothetical protein ACFFEO_04430 [Candidatus Thorarchaeota archaeon]